MTNVKILPYKVTNIRKIHFWGTSGCCIVIICMHTPTKSSLVVILRGSTKFPRPSVLEIWILLLFSSVWGISRLFPANRPWPKIWHLFFLTLLESYNEFLKRKWIYMEGHTWDDSAPRVSVIFQPIPFSLHLINVAWIW